MTRPVLLASLLLAAAPAVAAERNYSVTDFDRIQVEGPYQVTVTTGGFSRARAVGDQAAIDRLSLDVQGRTLRIRANRAAWGGYPGARSGTVRIEIGARSLTMASVIGPGSLAVDRAKGLKVDLSVSGSGRLAVAAVDADNLGIGLLGSGTISAGGKARQARVTIQGSGNLEGESLAADDAVVIADTAGRIAFAARRTARVTASGPGEVSIAGAASCTVTGPAAAGVTCGR
ncbi:GIN domain-containing protein [Sphingomonas parva]|nr:DUF2807 domain-containing protein [Sphingomonas parva]